MNKSARNKPPTVYVIAGPNGAGKTTFASEFLPDCVDCRQFLNADLIAAGLSPFAPETQNVKAGRLLLERIGELASAGEDFGFETTLSGRTYARLLTGLKRDGTGSPCSSSGSQVPTWPYSGSAVGCVKGGMRFPRLTCGDGLHRV
jgi:hypothetical protein